MRHALFVLLAPLLAACGSAPVAAAPCGPCQADPGAKEVPLPQSPKLKELALKRVELARKRLVLLRASFDRGTTTIDELLAGCRDVAFAARDSRLGGAERRDILKDYRDAVVGLRDLTRERASRGVVNEEAVSRVESLLAEADFWLEDASEGP